MEMNFLPIIVASLIPTLVGFIYYNPKTMGNAWMKSLGKTAEELQKGFNMPLVMIVGLVLSFFLALSTNVFIEATHHGVSEEGELIFASFHTFQHGALHGVFLAIFFAIPVLITNGMYERKSWKNLFINCGYWIITFALIGGLTDAWN